MARLVLLACLFAAAAAVPARESDTEFCNGITECPADCGFVSRNERCVYCRCGDSPLVQPVPLPEPEPQCKYGPAIIDECDNDCKCIKGGRYGCSRKPCMPGQRPEEPKTCSSAKDLPKRAGQRVFCHDGKVKVQSLDAKCLPEAVFMDEEDCNSCSCSSNGVAACTLKLCLKTEENQPQCKYGPAIIDECDNDCKCIKGGRYGCSRKLCMPGQRPEEPKTCSSAKDLPKRAGQRVFCHDGKVKVQSLDAKCLPEAVFMDEEDCNSCSCLSNGMAACTFKLCFKTEEKPPVTGCPHGPGFIDECNNDCNCVDGRFYGCTLKACKPGEKAESPMKCTSSDNLPSRAGVHVFCDEGVVKLQKKEAGCEHGPGFIDECNNDCNCVNGEFYGCTFKACKPGETAQSPMKCTSSDNLPSRAGVHVFCDEGIVKTQQPVCPYGPEFIDECGNDCRCLENGYACTLKSCKPGQTSMKPMACEGVKDLPGREGRRVICHENITKIQDEDDACLPGSVYALECNSCFCSETGQSGCTLKACIGEPKASTVTCEDGLPTCPADCGQVYNELRDCFDCPCGVGKPGDIAVQFEEPCPPGTVFSDSGAFFRTCKPSDKCPHGLAFIDECDNDCGCIADGYGCTRKACLPDQETMKPKQCKGSAQLPERKDQRVFCHEGIVKVQNKDDGCIPGSVFKQDCNSCFCGGNGQSGCTLKECLADSR